MCIEQTEQRVITATVVDEAQRLEMLPKYFKSLMGIVENKYYRMADYLSSQYQGAYWEFVELSNGGFFMYPLISGEKIKIDADVGMIYGEQEMSPVGFGLVVALFTYSHLAEAMVEDNKRELLLKQYHKVMEHAREHEDFWLILKAID